MVLIIAKTETGYRLTANPPHVKAKYSQEEILSRQEIIDTLLKHGAHQTDVGDVLSEADRNGIGFLIQCTKARKRWPFPKVPSG